MTLLPMLRMAAGVVFGLLLILSALWTFGVDVTPLLAGAGVFGLALGFGAQALVRDIISGVFYLAEDVFRVGEYIESGNNTRGTVERITLRTVALRHQNGPLHFVPYGSLGSVRNNSRDWSIDKFNIPLPVYVDSETVRKLIKKVGEAMQEDPEIGKLMLEPLKAKLYRIDPGVKIFRCKFRSAPGNQFEIRTEAYRRIEKSLKDAGIPFAAGTQVLINEGLGPQASQSSPSSGLPRKPLYPAIISRHRRSNLPVRQAEGMTIAGHVSVRTIPLRPDGLDVIGPRQPCLRAAVERTSRHGRR